MLRLLLGFLLTAVATPPSARAQSAGGDGSTEPAEVPEPTVERAVVPALPASPPELRLRLAAGIADTGFRGTMATRPGASTQDSSCSSSSWCPYSPVLDLGVDWSPSRYLGLGLRVRWVPGSERQNIEGRYWDVIEVLLAPQLSLPWKWRWPRGGLRPYLALPIGPAWSYESRVWTRAVAEEWHSRTGLSVGAALGFEFFVRRRWGFVVETSYQERFLSGDLVAIPVGEPEAQVTERVTLSQRHLTFSLGMLLGLDR